MPRNVEIKARIEDPGELEDRLMAYADGEPLEIHQDDTFFECSRGRLKLRAFSDEQGELIFYQRADASGPKESFYLISKTPEPAKLRDVLTLAYSVTGRVRKRRLLYFKGRTRIHLDCVEGLGNFLELEVVLADDEATQDGIVEAKAILSSLNVKETQLLEGAYIDLLQTGARRSAGRNTGTHT